MRASFALVGGRCRFCAARYPRRSFALTESKRRSGTTLEEDASRRRVPFLPKHLPGARRLYVGGLGVWSPFSLKRRRRAVAVALGGRPEPEARLPTAERARREVVAVCGHDRPRATAALGEDLLTFRTNPPALSEGLR